MLDQVYLGVYHPALVKLLANASHAWPAARVSVTLDVKFTEFTPYHDLPGFDKRAAERGYEAYLYDKFRTLRDLDAVPLYIHLDIPEMRRGIMRCLYDGFGEVYRRHCLRVGVPFEIKSVPSFVREPYVLHNNIVY